MKAHSSSSFDPETPVVSVLVQGRFGELFSLHERSTVVADFWWLGRSLCVLAWSCLSVCCTSTHHKQTKTAWQFAFLILVLEAHIRSKWYARAQLPPLKSCAASAPA